MAVVTWGHRYSKGRDWDGEKVSSRLPSHHFRLHLHGVPPPTSVPGCAAAGARAAAPAGPQGGVGSTGKEER